MRCDPTPAMAPTTPPPAPRSGSRAGDFGSVSLRKLRRDVAEASHHCLACEAKRTFGLPDPGRGPPARRPRRRPGPSPPGGHRSSGERPSQINRLLADAVMARSETPGRDHIDGYPQQGLQILGEPHLTEKRRLCLEVNEEVDVARTVRHRLGQRTRRPASATRDDEERPLRSPPGDPAGSQSQVRLGPHPKRTGSPVALVSFCTPARPRRVTWGCLRAPDSIAQTASSLLRKISRRDRFGGRCRARTDDLLVVSQLLYQLS